MTPEKITRTMATIDRLSKTEPSVVQLQSLRGGGTLTRTVKHSLCYLVCTVNLENVVVFFFVLFFEPIIEGGPDAV